MFNLKAKPRRTNTYLARVVEIGCEYSDNGRNRYGAKYMRLHSVPEEVVHRVLIQKLRRSNVPQSRFSHLRHRVATFCTGILSSLRFALSKRKSTPFWATPAGGNTVQNFELAAFIHGNAVAVLSRGSSKPNWGFYMVQFEWTPGKNSCSRYKQATTYAWLREG